MKKDYGNSQVLMCDYTQAKEIKVVLSEIADQVAGRLRHHQVQGEVISVGIDYADAEEAGTSGFGVQMKIYPTNHTNDLSPKKRPHVQPYNSCPDHWHSCRTIWQVMHELGIQSTMYRKRPKKPTTNTDTSQKPNLMRHLADLSGVVTTDITYIHLINQNLVYLATLFVVPRSHQNKIKHW